MKQCFFGTSPLYKKWGFNPCGFSKSIDSQMICTRDKNELRDWGCLYKCEYEKPEQIKLDLVELIKITLD